MAVVESERVKEDGGRGNVGPVALAQLRSVIADLLDLNELSSSEEFAGLLEVT